MINLTRNKNICCGLKKVVAKSRARVYFEQQIWALLLVFHQIHNLSRNKLLRALANQPFSAPHFFNLQQMFLLRVKLITQGEKRETLTKTCNETMLRDKLKVFVSRISPPLKERDISLATNYMTLFSFLQELISLHDEHLCLAHGMVLLHTINFTAFIALQVY